MTALLALIAVIAPHGTPAKADGLGPEIVIERESGKILYSRGMHNRWHPASLTKLMSVYVALSEIRTGRFSLSSPVRISENALSEPPSKMGFPIGTVLTVEAAMQIMMVKSANDVSTALAEAIGGSEVQFANLMNRYARRIGMSRSNWMNAHGLHHPRQYSTPHDLALLSKRLLEEFPEHRDLFALPAIQVGGRTHRNHNALMRRFDGTTGMKTGYICAGGLSLVASAKIEGLEYIVVTMGHKKSRLRNVRAAELLTTRSRMINRVGLDVVGEVQMQDGFTAEAIDVTEEVCGKRRGIPVERGFDFSDPAIELYAIRKPGPGELGQRYLMDGSKPYQAVTVVLGGADGPDPYELLVEKPPFVLAMEGFQSRPHAKIGDTIVALPTRHPELNYSANKLVAAYRARLVTGDDVELSHPSLGTIDSVREEKPVRVTLENGTVIALPSRSPLDTAEGESSEGG